MKHFIAAVVLFFAGAFGVLTYRYIEVRNVPPFARTPSTFTLTPPSRARTGLLGKTTGTVKILLRENTDFVDATPSSAIRQGESLATDPRSGAEITFGDTFSFTMGPMAEVALVNLIPDKTVLQQKSGRVTYDIRDMTAPLSVRVLHTLVSISSGSAVITIAGPGMSVHVPSGAAAIGMIDLDNNTHVWKLEAGNRALIDDATRTLSLTR